MEAAIAQVGADIGVTALSEKLQEAYTKIDAEQAKRINALLADGKTAEHDAELFRAAILLDGTITLPPYEGGRGDETKVP